ncbi:MAG: L-carnitine dehydratase/bile acid-inducible protein, partial [Phenylobacterium sp.]|nr:L-carnitine dehydratase/bile acid-inducible protein [Phenylobacterium sp.]
GAEVIRVESPAQAGQRSLVIGQVGLSRGKRSITLDQRNPAANDVLRRLAQACDVLVENARPGAMSARGFGYPEAAQVAPRLIWCSITGFGQDGPSAEWAGHDLSYLGHSGLMGTLSPSLPWHPGAMLSVPLGAMMAATGVLAALLERGRTGKGCQIDISLSESALWLLSGAPGALAAGYGGISATHDRRLYACADGRFVSVAAAEPRTWAALCAGLDAGDLAEKLKATGAESAAVAERLAEIFQTRPAAEWVAMLGPLGAAVNAVNQGADIAADPHHAARGAVLEVAGRQVPASPLRLIDAEGRRSGTALEEPPLVGEHTETVLGEAGFNKDEIAALRADGVI